MTLQQDSEVMKNKVAVITGGAKGIGFAVASALVERGVKVVIGDVLREQGQAAVKALNEKAGSQVALFEFCDVRFYADNKKLFQTAEVHFGGVDIAILNAGIAGLAADTLNTPLDDEAERLIFDINTLGVVKGAKVAIMHMIKRGGGVIVNTASVAGIVGSPGLSSYSATKHAVIGFTRSFEHLGAMGIRVNAVCPYWVETDIIDLRDENGDPASIKEVLDASPKVPMKEVVETYLKFIRDDELSGEAYIVAPDGHHEHPRADLPESCISEEMLEAIAKQTPLSMQKTMDQLQGASKAYFSKL
ncbi:NAD(P)-binding protein [Hesseltinella vesiculosa]|uniref:NAD(P)-binding protein n=1 Tax=Hesseltinella vesiculosa TaxID=101127 RepID=A0A1X2GMT1_9FUNG|nr:NAD(P)-binding protein [Hesseltinella vesiculosa]